MSTELELNEEHVDEAMALLIEQFKGATNLRTFITTFINRVQEAEAMLFDLWQSRWLDNATGEQLDGLGAIVVIELNNDSDDLYRVRIRARIYTNVSRGTADDIIRIAALLAGVDVSDVVYYDTYPAGFVLSLFGLVVSADSVSRVVEAVHDAAPAGVSFTLLYALSPEPNTFRFGASMDLSTGGYMSGAASSS
jgi:hypothetical protein